MKRQRYSLLVLVGVLAMTPAAYAQATKPAAKPATAAQTPAPAAPAAPARLVPPVRGDVKVEMTEPARKNNGKVLTTTFKVKNLETGSIAGLVIDEFWYDAKGDPVTGGTWRATKPIQPGEIVDVKIEIAVNPKMQRNQYMFKQANGKVKPTQVKKVS